MGSLRSATGWTVLAAFLAAEAASAAAPVAVYVGRRDGSGAVRLSVFQEGSETAVESDLDGSEWRPFGLRGLSPSLPRSPGSISLVRGELPRLEVRADFHLVLFRSLARESEGLGAVGPWGARTLLAGGDGRYRTEDEGLAVSADGRWLGMVVRGREVEEVYIVELSGASPHVFPVTVDRGVKRIEPRSLSLSAGSLFVAVEDEEGSRLLRAALPGGEGAGSRAEVAAGPFTVLRPSVAVSPAGVLFLAGASEDALDVHLARDAGPVLNLTRSPGEYRDHRSEAPSLALSEDGSLAAYHLRTPAGVETFLHLTELPGDAGRTQVTSDERFNPYIDQESWLLFNRSGNLVFAAGHDPVTTDLFRASAAGGIQVLNLTRTGSDLLPPFLTTGTLAVRSVVVLPADYLLVEANGFERGTARAVVEVSAASGEARVEAPGLGAVGEVFLVGGDLYFTAAADGTRSLVRLREGSFREVARSPAGDAPRLLALVPGLAVVGAPGTGLLALAPAAEPRLLAPAERFAPAAALSPDRSRLLFARESAGGSLLGYFVVDLATGRETPLGESPPGGEPLALGFLAAPAFVRGDANADGRVDISDPISTLFSLFLGGEPLPCPDAADADDDGLVSITDPIRVLEYLFSEGRRLEAPFPEAGLDPTPDGLSCL